MFPIPLFVGTEHYERNVEARALLMDIVQVGVYMNEPAPETTPSPDLAHDLAVRLRLWGANYYPGRGPDDCLEYTALINIRPSRGNRSMEIEDPVTRERVRDLAFRLIGPDEPLP